MKRSGRKSAAQTPAPKGERIYGSSKNPKGSAKSQTSGASINFTDEIIDGLKKKVADHNKKYPTKKVRLSTLKSVFRRGAGAYSSSHRPTITGGAPNSRTAWAYARVNKFLEKKAGKKVKAAYVQDDDLMAKGGIMNQQVVCQRCGWSWNTKDSDPSDKYVCHKCGHDNSWYYGSELADKGLLNSIYGNIKKSLSIYGLILDKNYNLSDGSNKTYLPHFGMERHDDQIKKVTVTYYEEEMDVLGEMEIEVEDEGVEVEIDFPKLGIKEEIEPFENGGKMDKQIALPDTYSSYDKLKPILDNQGYVLKKRGGELPVGKLAKGMTLSEVAKLHGLKADDLKKELKIGIEREMEHTDSPEIARAIAMDHLYEDEKYYTKLKKMEGVDKHMVEITKKYAQGGEIHEIYSFKTPTGEKSRLTYLQQVLVRTSGFKEFFGDWEMAAKSYLLDQKENFEKHYQNVSKVLDMVTLEPRVLYHGTSAEKEFYHFDVTKEVGVGRPYGYFAHNKEYSQNFTKFSQRTTRDTKPILYEIFANVRSPFMALGQQYELKKRTSEDWETIITGTISWDKYKTMERSKAKDIDLAVSSQIGKYLKDVFGEPRSFWMSMANDREKDFKYFLMSYGYDGIFYTEEFQTPFDETDPAQYTKAVCIFDSKQVKLADGRNLNFNPMLDDIRYDEGGEVEDTLIDNSLEVRMNSKDKLAKMLFGGQFAEGGKVISDDVLDPNDGKKGGYFKGRSHANGGIKAINVDTGQLIEVEGEEVIITKGAVNDNTKREFEGEMLTNREILSRINQSGGGVAFEDGGEVSACGCKGSKYKYGGEVMEDYMILRKMNEPFKLAQQNISKARSYVDDLVAKMK